YIPGLKHLGFTGYCCERSMTWTKLPTASTHPSTASPCTTKVRGAGRPLVLLHGALSAIGTSFGKVLPSLAKTRQVIAIEQQAHGHTADIDRPLTIEQMADDTA